MEVIFPSAVSRRSGVFARRFRRCAWSALLVGVLGLWWPPRSAAAPFDFTGPVTTVSVTPGAGVVTLDALDPGLGSVVSSNITLFGGPTPSDAVAMGGFAAWSSGTRVFQYAYDPFRQLWVGTNSNTGATFDLRTTNGVVAWTSGSTAHYSAYNWTRNVWVKDSAAIGSPATSLDIVDGVAAGSTAAGVFYAVFDPVRGVWAKSSAATGVPGEFKSAEGVVAWSAGNFVFGRAYDPRLGLWKEYNQNAGGTPFDLRNSGGVLAWTQNPYVGYAAFDGPRGVWTNRVENVGFATELTVSNSTVYWKTSQPFRRGFRPGTTGWTNNVTAVQAAFLPSTNSLAAPVTIAFIDLSLGGSAWSWNFSGGEGAATRRSPLVRFATPGQYLVAQTVAGDGGFSSTNAVIVTDLGPPFGSLTINNGDATTTNPAVVLQLVAADNSGTVVSMRLANDTTNNWTAWEAYAPTKNWTLSAGTGLKTVFAQYRDGAGNVSTNAFDTITLDSTPPPVLSLVDTNVLEQAGSAVILAVLDHPINRTVSARFVTSDGTATDGEDYTRQEGVIVFPPNTTQASLVVPILADAQVEVNETLFINLSNPTNAILAGPGTVTIVDDDAASVAFASANFNAAEDAGSATVSLRLNAASGQPVSVRVLAQAGTAADGRDFRSTNAVLVFQPGQTNRTFQIAILDDLEDELTETISLSLTNLTNAVVGVPAVATVSILDNDQPLVFFSRDAYSGFESDFSIPVSVWLSKPFSQQASASFTIFGGSATPGVDYTVLGTVIFPAGTTNATITVFPINDEGREADETVRLRLTDIAGASAGRIETTVTILDDDGAPRFVSAQVLAGQFRASIRGKGQQAFDVQSSTNLQDWVFSRRLTNSAAGSSEFASPLTDPARTYRTMVP